MKLAVLSGSVLAGPGQTLPAIHQALDLLSIDCEVISHAHQWRLLRQNLPFLESVLTAQPDIVVFGHGEGEALIVRRPKGAGFITEMPYESPFTVWRRDWVHRLKLGNRRTVERWRRYESDTRKTVRAFVARTPAVVVMVGTTGAAADMSPAAVRFRLRRDELIESLAQEYPGRVCPLWPSSVLRQWEDFRQDHIHLSPSGQEAIGRLLAECISSTVTLD